MSNYTRQKFVWGPCCGRLRDDPSGLPLELPLIKGNCTYARGIDAPGSDDG